MYIYVEDEKMLGERVKVDEKVMMNGDLFDA